MATAVSSDSHAAPHADASPRPADAFVSFGITGDLAKVMTFRSLYRLEKRGLLDCPILGVAVQDWSPDDLREHARAAIEGTGEASTPTSSNGSRRDCPTSRATSAMRERTSGSRPR